MVPEDWSFKSLDSAKIKVVDGDRGKEYPKAGDFLETGYCLFLSAKNVTKAGFLFEELQFINEDKDKKLRKGRVERGNIVLTTRGSVGQFAYFDNSGGCPRLCVTGLPSDTVASDRRHHEQGQTPHQRRAA